MYNNMSNIATEFIDNEEIMKTLEYAEQNKDNVEILHNIFEKAERGLGLNYTEAIVLLYSKSLDEKIFELAMRIKQRNYGNRIVMFAPLYLSNYCVNECVYCPYSRLNKSISRRKLTQQQIRDEVIALQDMGHKRLALEIGEDPVNLPIDYVLESIKTIYNIKHKNGAIRRVNVNIAATDIDSYKKLKDAGIGTYILFQETYHRETYLKLHPHGPKHNYDYHTEAMDRAMTSGIEDVGLGVLFGLYNYAYDFVGLLMHAEHLEKKFGVGPHTISVPRICSGDGVSTNDFPNAISDYVFKKLVALLRISLPYAGIIISTRESEQIRSDVLKLGVSQISGGSKTSVGGYTQNDSENNSSQFDVSDTRTLDEIVQWLLSEGYVPSFCTACYREGRTGDRFMQLVKSGQIANICQANSLMTLNEFIEDYASTNTKLLARRVIEEELQKIPSDTVKQIASENIKQMENGKRDFRF